ncbi:MAG: hypothetical protein QG639_870, partial [Patescibacteria group bacterium]|nr:hypothetical protein [Patescibacteria group bacterium]
FSGNKTVQKDHEDDKAQSVLGVWVQYHSHTYCNAR